MLTIQGGALSLLLSVCGVVAYSLILMRSRWAQAHLPQIVLGTMTITFLAALASIAVCPGVGHKVISAVIAAFLLRVIVAFVPIAKNGCAASTRMLRG